MNMAAGGLPARLRKDGYVERVGVVYRITRAGLEYLGRRGRPIDAVVATPPVGVGQPRSMGVAPMVPSVGVAPPPVPAPMQPVPPSAAPPPGPRRWGTATNGVQVPLIWDGAQRVYRDLGTRRYERWGWG